jgi:predicted acetyltransferase
MVFRDYDPARDREAVRRIWQEVGWHSKDKEEAMYLVIEAGPAMVAEVDGEAECLVQTVPGAIRYLREDLPFICVTGVTTSHVARKQGFPRQLVATLLARAVANGAILAGLGMFEQGFYNQLGFGTGGYEHSMSFDPAQLRVPVRARVPRRVTNKDWEMVHACRLARRRGHGSCNLTPPTFTQSEMLYTHGGFGLGYCDGANGELTHHVWCGCHGDMERGPYEIQWMAFQTPEQFLELLAVIRNLGDQVRLVKMRELPGIQMQDLLDKPLKHREVTEKSKFEVGVDSLAYWQMRICDVAACLAKTHLRCSELRFNLSLTDPLARYLEGSAWQGAGGKYIITLGAQCAAESGDDPSLPTLTATVPSFTRLWLGVRPATGLAITDDLSGPQALLEQLDEAFLLPEPHPDWDF